jgi:Cu2+-containing amine oxidase
MTDLPDAFALLGFQPLDWDPVQVIGPSWRLNGADLRLRRDHGRDIHIHLGMDVKTGFVLCAVGYVRNGTMERPRYYSMPVQSLAALFAEYDTMNRKK